MPGKVADASLLGAVVFGEPRAEEAASLIGEADLYEPTLLAYELASIARKKIVSNPEQRDVLLQALMMSLSMNISWSEVNQLEVLNLALATGLTTYDASYLYLAKNLGLDLVTFDQRLQAAGSA